jgi:hypothetical protein
MMLRWGMLLTKLVDKREPGLFKNPTARRAFRRQAGVSDCGKLSPYAIPPHCPKFFLIYRVNYLQKEKVVLSQLAKKIEEEEDLPGTSSQ